jgi:hypothetical protein
MPNDGCLVRPGHDKTAGATVYLMEELGDARMRCDELVRYVEETVRLIEDSPHRDHFYEVAGHLLHAGPLTLFKLQKALQAVALAANRIDYEEIKQDLRPEKVKQLENVLQDVRIRQVQRRSEPPAITPQYVADKLRQFAATAKRFQLPQNEVAQLIIALEEGCGTEGPESSTADRLEKIAAQWEVSKPKKKEAQEDPLEDEYDRLRLAGILRQMIGDVHVKSSISAIRQEAPETETDMKTAENWKITAALKPKDKKVVDAFYERSTAEGYLLSTDGKTLSKHGMGGGTFAEWKGGKIHILSPGGNKTHDAILRYMKKSIPKNNLADHPQLRAAGVTGPTRMQIQKKYDSLLKVHPERKAQRMTQDALGLSSMRVNDKGTVVDFKTAKTAEETDMDKEAWKAPSARTAGAKEALEFEKFVKKELPQLLRDGKEAKTWAKKVESLAIGLWALLKNDRWGNRVYGTFADQAKEFKEAVSKFLDEVENYKKVSDANYLALAEAVNPDEWKTEPEWQQARAAKEKEKDAEEEKDSRFEEGKPAEEGRSRLEGSKR